MSDKKEPNPRKHFSPDLSEKDSNTAEDDDLFELMVEAGEIVFDRITSRDRARLLKEIGYSAAQIAQGCPIYTEMSEAEEHARAAANQDRRMLKGGEGEHAMEKFEAEKDDRFKKISSSLSDRAPSPADELNNEMHMQLLDFAIPLVKFEESHNIRLTREKLVTALLAAIYRGNDKSTKREL